ncbi:unnamed protein product [Polarella glacialis]|uniref:GMP phosphodiesterase delta subunit domain-containing protein n=1 Tax=Polarella glacialis TaxID=89957 RepID=A0A813F6A3_POLGL|nr:unnamed protein product [Polarella glacialis]
MMDEEEQVLVKAGPELFTELLRVYAVADVDDYYKNGAWRDEMMRNDWQLIVAHRKEAGAPEPPPLEEVKVPELPGPTGASSGMIAGLLASKLGVPAAAAGGAAAAVAPGSVDAELRLIGLFVAKWRLDDTRTKTMLAKQLPQRRRYVIANFKVSEECADSTKVLEEYIAACEKSSAWGEPGSVATMLRAGIASSPAVVGLQSGVKRSLSAALQGGGAPEDPMKRLRMMSQSAASPAASMLSRMAVASTAWKPAPAPAPAASGSWSGAGAATSWSGAGAATSWSGAGSAASATSWSGKGAVAASPSWAGKGAVAASPSWAGKGAVAPSPSWAVNRAAATSGSWSGAGASAASGSWKGSGAATANTSRSLLNNALGGGQAGWAQSQSVPTRPVSSLGQQVSSYGTPPSYGGYGAKGGAGAWSAGGKPAASLPSADPSDDFFCWTCSSLCLGLWVDIFDERDLAKKPSPIGLWLVTGIPACQDLSNLSALLEGQRTMEYAPLDDAAGGAEDEARLQAIREGFGINWMNMRDASTGQILWEHHDWDFNQGETEAQVPRDILKCRQVSRELNFSSVEIMNSLRLVQSVIFKDELLEEWNFQFGFVIPNSTNTWQQTIEAAEEEEMIPAELLSGNVVIETTFLDGDSVIMTQKVRIFYV